ncbi:MAG: MurR/RpiR family transcriptional regulator [Alphaproteobacteria bacterium]|nr:MurR/RpiR family transcriptional regulator [Alphaproteobacteria bacterium]
MRRDKDGILKPPSSPTVASSPLIERLHQQLPELPEGQRAVLDYLLADPQSTARETIAQIAEKAQVSMPTVVRTCQRFGYSTVREFMLDLVQDLAAQDFSLHRSISPGDDTAGVIAKITQASVTSLKALGDSLEVQLLDRIVERLAVAERIDCYSVGMASRFMAEELQSRLFRLGRPAHAIFDAHQQLISANSLGPRGVALVISHVGRMPYMLEAAHFAQSQGATVIALTQPDTPLARLADLVVEISVPPDAVMWVGTEAYLAHLLVIEILMVRLAARLGPVVAHDLQQFRTLLAKHGFDSHSYRGFREPIVPQPKLDARDDDDA